MKMRKRLTALAAYSLLVATLVAVTWPTTGLAQEEATKRPTNLIELLQAYGTDLLVDRWLDGLKDFHYLLADDPAFNGHKGAAQRAIEAYEKKEYKAAALLFHAAFKALLAHPTGNDSDGVWAALLWRACHRSWKMAEESCQRAGLHETPRDADAFDEVFPDAAAAHEKEREHFKAYCYYYAGFHYLIEKGRDLTSIFSEAEQDDRLVRMLLGEARSLATLGGMEAQLLSSLQSVLNGLEKVIPKDTGWVLEKESRSIIGGLDEAVGYAVAGYVVQTKVASFVAQLSQQKGETSAYGDAIHQAKTIADSGTRLEWLYYEVAAKLGSKTGRNLEIHRLAANLNQVYLQLLLTRARQEDPRSEEGMLLLVELSMVIKEAQKSLALVVDNDSKDWASRLTLAELVMTEKGNDTGTGPVVTGESAQIIQALITSAQDIGKDSADALYKAGRLLLISRLGGAEQPLQRFLELFPGDPRADEVKKVLEGLGNQQ